MLNAQLIDINFNFSDWIRTTLNRLQYILKFIIIVHFVIDKFKVWLNIVFWRKTFCVIFLKCDQFGEILIDISYKHDRTYTVLYFFSKEKEQTYLFCTF